MEAKKRMAVLLGCVVSLPALWFGGTWVLDKFDFGSEESWKRHLSEAALDMQAEKFAQAEIEYRAASRESARFGANDQRHAHTLLDLGKVQAKLDHYEDAEQSLKQAEAIFTKQMPASGTGEDERDVAINLSQTLQVLADVDCGLGRQKAADENYSRALDLATKNLASDALRYEITTHYAGLLKGMGRAEEAQKLTNSITDLLPSRPNEKQILGNSWEELNKGAMNARQGGNFAEAERLYHKAMDQIVKGNVAGSTLADEDAMHLSTSFTGLAEVYDAQNKYSEAENLLTRSLQVLKDCKSEHRAQMSATLYRQALVKLHAGAVPEAEKILREAIKWESNPKRPDHSGVLERRMMEDLAKILMQEGKYKEAEDFMTVKLDSELKRYGKDSEKVVINSTLLAQICEKQNKLPDAEKHFRTGMAVFERRKPTPPEIASQLQIEKEYAQFLRRHDRPAEAEKIEKKAHDDEKEAENAFLGKE